MEILISAIVCTHNRPEFLTKAVQSLLDQTLSGEKYEIIVIDNASSDNTRSVFDRQYSHVANIRYYFEPRLGLSCAKNSGWKNARAPIVAFLDDDAIAPTDWLQKIIEAFDTADRKVACVGGRVDPIWEAPRPSWLTKEIENYLGLINYSESPFFTPHIIGCNCSYRKEALEEMGGFNIHLGRVGKALLSGEETLLQLSLEEKGYLSLYHPYVKVRHYIPKERLNKKYFIRLAFRFGVTSVLVGFYLKRPSLLRRLRTVMRYIKELFSDPGVISYSLHFLTGKRSFSKECAIVVKLGRVFESVMVIFKRV
ncbi:MAG: glycosyltransferase family 2 protein [Candidatus Omnitrophota bacterium]|jgi:glycosyltransferase involved in cell wall biosynthesis|nr:glycosyltransferase family 2 protein [Candidatus Omnitrophota bacterium]